LPGIIDKKIDDLGADSFTVATWHAKNEHCE